MADGTSIDEFADQIFTAFKRYVDGRLCDLKSVEDSAMRAQSSAEGVAASIEALKSVALTLRPGRDGVDGKDGADGKSVDPEVIRSMVSDEVSSAVAKIPAARDGVDGKSVDMGEVRLLILDAVKDIPLPVDGKDGINGKDGSDGQDGADGVDGKDGLNGQDGKSVDPSEVRAMIADAVKSAVDAIPRPVDGERGAKGEDGRDALQIDVLDALDASKSYPRGTYAKHNGGMLRSYRETDPIAGVEVERCGWQVLINPVVSLSVKQDESNPKRLVVTSTKAFGMPAEVEINIPSMVYRGVFREGDQYTKGDTATWGGSLWHCNAESTQQKPGLGGDDWVLAVKRGADGKPGKDGINGKDGKVIR